ncbi:hypothetical protein [Streptomyces sp. NPDC059631]|uniref:hypothetical protein n=1 Tax=unclassified Streptomyces TaxID=2593676 RepID=UPI0036A333AA
MFARADDADDADDGFYTIMIDDRAPHSLLALVNGAEQQDGPYASSFDGRAPCAGRP